MVTMIIGTQLDDNSVRRVSSDIERRFNGLGQNVGGDFMRQFADGASQNAPRVQRAIDRAADAVGRLRREEARLQQLQSQDNVTRDRLVAQSERVASANRAQARAVETARRSYEEAAQSSGRLTLAAGSLRGVLDATPLGQYSDQVEALAGRLGTAGQAAGLAVAGFAVAGKVLYDLGAQWDAIGDSIYMATGQSEAGMAGITDSIKRVADDTAAPLDAIGKISGQVVQSLKVTGPVLDAMTQRLAILEQAGNGVSPRNLAKAYNVFGIEAGDQAATLDKLFNVSRDTGIPMEELVQNLNNAGRATKQFNLDAAQTAGLLASFEAAGLDSSKTTQALTIALKNFSKEGKDAGPALAAAIQQIQDLADAGRDSDAAMLASATFGGKAYLDMLNAIKDHKIDLDQLSGAFDANGESITDAADKTADLSEEWTKFVNGLKNEAEPAATSFFNNLNDLLEPVLRQSREMRDIQKELNDEWQNAQYPFPQGIGPGPNAQRARRGLPGIDPTGGLIPGAPTGDPALSGLPNGQPLPPATGSRAGGNGGVFGEPNVPFWSYPKKAGDKPVIDPSRYSLDSIPIGSFGPASQLNGAGSPMGAPTRGPSMLGPDGKLGYYEHDPQKVFDAETALISQKQAVENARLKVLELEADNNSKQSDIDAAKVARLLAERQYISQQQKLAEAQQGTWKKMEDTAKKFADGMDDIGAALDNDFGLSDGLPGLAENLTKFIANLAAAPLLGPLSAIKQAAGDEGSGLMGMLASNGAFGPRFMPNKSDKTGYNQPGYGPYSLGPAALQPGLPPGYGVPGAANVYSGPHTEDTHGLLTPRAAALKSSLEKMFPGIDIGGYRSPDGFNEHSSGEALDIMVGNNKALGDQINQYLLQNAQALGLQYDLWQQASWRPDGSVSPMEDRGGATANHRDHVHARLQPGPIPGGAAPGGSWGGIPSIANTVGPTTPPSPTTPWLNTGLPNTVVGSPGQGFPLPWNLGGGPPLSPWANPGPSDPTGGLLSGPLNSGVPGPGSGASPGPAGWFGGGGAPGVGGATNLGAPFGQPGVGGAGGSSLIPGQSPGAIPGAGPGMSQGIGGIPLAAAQAAASSLDMLAPGAGAAANLGIQLANRSIGYLGQQAGNLASGLFETFTLSGSGGPTDPLKTLPGRLLAGIAGARPSLPNTSGGGVQQPQQKQGDPSQIGGAARNGGPMVNIEQVNQAPGQEPTSVANEVASQFRSAELASGSFRR